MSKALKEARPFAETMVAWQKLHGRHHLPWQNTQDPYRVWLSEIMLQQTQVSTVLAYYEKFLQHFPTVADLAAASQDKVMGLFCISVPRMWWPGLMANFRPLQPS